MSNDALWIELTSITKAEGAVLQVEKEFPAVAFYEVDKELPLCTGVTLKGSITNLSGNLFLKGTLDFTFLFECDRCLKEFREDYSIEINEVIAKEGSDFEEDEYIPYSSNKVLLTEGIYKCIYPLTLDKHICKEDCKGLCTKCGCNLNEKDCGCEDDEIDPRLEKLKDFFKN